MLECHRTTQGSQHGKREHCEHGRDIATNVLCRGYELCQGTSSRSYGPRASGKGKQVRPPALLAQTGTTGPHGDSRSSSPSSKAASARSSAYRAVHEAAKARKALLDAQIGVKQAASQLSERKARCDREHQSIMEEIEAVQTELRTSTERQAQGHEIQAARMDAMGCRMAEIKDMVTEREVRMEAQLQEVCSQIQAMGTMLKNIQPQPAPASNTIKELLQDTDISLPKPMKSVSLKPKESVTTATNPSGSKQHLARYAPLPQTLVSNGEAASIRQNLSRLRYQQNIFHPPPKLTRKNQRAR